MKTVKPVVRHGVWRCNAGHIHDEPMSSTLSEDTHLPHPWASLVIDEVEVDDSGEGDG